MGSYIFRGSLKYYSAVVILAFMFSSCSDKTTDSNSGVDVSMLNGSFFSTAVMDNNNSLVLMGWLVFDDVEDEAVHGRWCFETWGTQSHFPEFPVITDSKFPDKSNLSPFTGSVHGDMVIVKLPMPGTTDSIGIVLDEQRGDELFGTVSLLPGLTFKGRMKALRQP